MVGRVRLTEEQTAELHTLLRGGNHTYAQITEIFGISHAGVAYHARKLGITRRGPEGTPSVSSLPIFGFPDWMRGAHCAQTDPEAFFPDRGGSSRSAKSMCGSCDVTAQCLDYALDNHEPHGVWGGKSERERRKILRTREKPEAAA